MSDIIKEMNEFSEMIFERTGWRMDVEQTIANLRIADECEQQRLNSLMPNIPVVSKIEFENRVALDEKLKAFGTDFFFFLKSEEEEFDSEEYPSFFDDFEDDELDTGEYTSVSDDFEYDPFVSFMYHELDDVILKSGDFLRRWAEVAEATDKIRVKRKIPDNVGGEVGRMVDGKMVFEKAESYVMVLGVDRDELPVPVGVIDVYPI